MTGKPGDHSKEDFKQEHKMENSILYRCNGCNSELVGTVTGDSSERVKAPTDIGCLVCSGSMIPVGELTPEQVDAWRKDEEQEEPAAE